LSRLRLRVALFQTERPLDSAQNKFLIRLTFPDILAMSERRVENFSLANLLAPRNRIIARRAVIRMFVEREQPVNLLAMKIFELINLVEHFVNRREIFCRRMFRILVDALDF